MITSIEILKTRLFHQNGNGRGDKMKTREQIYSYEAADILRNVTTYHYIHHNQLLKLYPNKEDKIENLLSFLVRQGRIQLDKTNNLYYDTLQISVDYEMLSAIWVLTDFIEEIEYHSSTDFPSKIVFIANEELYEIIYVAPGNETLIGHALSQQVSDTEKRIVIVEDSKQISELMLPDVTAYCTVNIESGAIQYYKQE